MNINQVPNQVLSEKQPKKTSKQMSKPVAFTGHARELDNKGEQQHRFFLPHDSKRYNVFLELFHATEQKDGQWKVDDKKREKSIKLPEKGISLDINKYFEKDKQFAYRFRLEDTQNNNDITYAFDSGIVTNINDEDKADNKFNIIIKDRAITNKDGKMQLIFPDGYYPGMVMKNGKPKLDNNLRQQALDAVRIHDNRLGGTLAGIIERLPSLKKEGYTRIVGTPFTQSAASHLYWTENALQLSDALGKMNDFKILQEELFKNDMNWVSDGAFVNEGFQGTHFKHVLKWGDQSPFYDWFKTKTVNGQQQIGIFPENSEHIRFKLVNSPKNEGYNSKKPTFVQFYDDRLASEEQKTNNKLFTTYNNKNPRNKYDVSTYDDSMTPFSFEIDPEVYEKNLKEAKKSGEVDLTKLKTIKKLMEFENFALVERTKDTGAGKWDGSIDIAKLNFYLGNEDQDFINKKSGQDKIATEAKMRHGVYQVQDYALQAGTYWTKLTADIQLNAAAKTFKNVPSDVAAYKSKIKEEVKNGNLPKTAEFVMNDEVIKNVLDGSYKLNRLKKDNDKSYSHMLLSSIMDYPLDELRVSPELSAVIASPYIAKRPFAESEIGQSRYDILTKNKNKNIPDEFKKTYEQMDKIYASQLLPFVHSVLSGANENSKLFTTDNNGKKEATDLGKYVIQSVSADLTKYALFKSLDKNADIKIDKDGNINFDNVVSDEITIKSIGANAQTPKGEAQKVVSKISSGISRITQEEKDALSKAVSKKIEGLNANSFKMAEALVDRTESGLGWRIDAAKDIASFDAVRNNKDSAFRAWDAVSDFWTKFSKKVYEQNPHAYTTAEITDMDSFMEGDGSQQHQSALKLETKFIEKTGLTSLANYNYFYSMPAGLYANGAEDGSIKDGNTIYKITYGDFGDGGIRGLMYQFPQEGVAHSYTFSGNHDKPRLLHVMGLDMGLFYSDFKNADHKSAAAWVLEKKDNDWSDINFEKISPRGIAMGHRLKQAFEVALGTKDSPEYKKISGAIKHLAGDDKKVGDAFGARPFEIVIKDVMDKAGIKNKKVEDKALENVLVPAMDKYRSVYKTLVTLPGDPTDFAGDKIGSSGYDSKAKNITQQNRNVIRWEWIDPKSPDYKPFVKEFHDDINKMLDLRNKPLLSALNNGTVVSLEPGNDCAASLRYNNEGSQVICLYTTSGKNFAPNEMMKRETKKIDSISLNTNQLKQGLKAGLTQGAIFYDAKEMDKENKTIYKVVKDDNGGYSIKRPDGNKIEVTDEDKNVLVLYRAEGPATNEARYRVGIAS